MALQQCPYRAEVKSASEIRDLCVNVEGQDGGSLPHSCFWILPGGKAALQKEAGASAVL